MYPRLKELRLEKGLTQKQVAAYLYVTLPAYRRYERGESHTPLSVLRALVTLYDTSMDYLVNLTDERQPYPRI